MTTHELQGTVTTLLVESRRSDSVIALRAGHRALRSLQNSQNLQGVEGAWRQDDLRGGENLVAKRASELLTTFDEESTSKKERKEITGEAENATVSITAYEGK